MCNIKIKSFLFIIFYELFMNNFQTSPFKYPTSKIIISSELRRFCPHASLQSAMLFLYFNGFHHQAKFKAK